MISRHITHVETLSPVRGPLPAELKAELAGSLPRASVRRFSDSGLMVHALLERLALREDEPLVSASTFAESRSLEEFIDSFPTPSPARFQRSVHPGAVQQARVSAVAPLRTYLPLAGQDGLAITALRTALCMDAESVVLIGMEECGTWSVALDAGSDTAFAFAIRLDRSVPASGSLGTVCWDAQPDGGLETDCSMPYLFAHLHERKPLDICHPDMGRATICWSGK